MISNIPEEDKMQGGGPKITEVENQCFEGIFDIKVKILLKSWIWKIFYFALTLERANCIFVGYAILDWVLLFFSAIWRHIPFISGLYYCFWNYGHAFEDSMFWLLWLCVLCFVSMSRYKYLFIYPTLNTLDFLV